MKKEFKQQVTFLDKDRNKIKVTVETTFRNGYKELTMSGDMGNGGGQIVDSFIPANKEQKKLVDLWKKYHLNGMSAGTKEQNEILKSPKFSEFKSDINSEIERAKTTKELANISDPLKYAKAVGKATKFFEDEKGSKWSAPNLDGERMALKRKFKEGKINGIKISDWAEMTDYDIQKLWLQSNKLLTVSHPETGEPYTYGHGWITEKLPKNIEKTITTLIAKIEELEEQTKGKDLKDFSDSELLEIIEEQTGYTDRDGELAAAFVRMLDLSESDLQDIKIDDNRSTIQGIDYYAGTDEEMDEEWDNDLDNYLDELVLPELQETVRRYFDREAWKKDARQDGRSHSLNRYDGGEISTSINDTLYYAYRN
jgi:hypothetical protein